MAPGPGCEVNDCTPSAPSAEGDESEDEAAGESRPHAAGARLRLGWRGARRASMSRCGEAKARPPNAAPQPHRSPLRRLLRGLPNRQPVAVFGGERLAAGSHRPRQALALRVLVLPRESRIRLCQCWTKPSRSRPVCGHQSARPAARPFQVMRSARRQAVVPFGLSKGIRLNSDCNAIQRTLARARSVHRRLVRHRDHHRGVPHWRGASIRSDSRMSQLQARLGVSSMWR